MCPGNRGLPEFESRRFGIGDGRTDGGGHMLQDWKGERRQFGRDRGRVREVVCVVFFSFEGLRIA